MAAEQPGAEMATISSPVLFSTHFGVSADEMDRAGFIDPFLNVDTQLFIDPVLLAKSSHAKIREEAYGAFCRHFDNFVRLLSISEREGDAAWRSASRFLDLREPPENGLGYGGSRRAGSSRPDEVRLAVMRTASDIIRLGSKDPEMISLMGFFEENVGPDTISDFTTRVIINQLGEMTESFCEANGVPTEKLNNDVRHRLPMFTDGSGKKNSAVLVPKDIVRELPMANDWSDIDAAAAANARIRDRVNELLANIARPTTVQRKAALRRAVTESAEHFDSFLNAIKDFASHYGPNKDSLGYYQLKEIIRTGAAGFKSDKQFDMSAGIDAIVGLVRETIDMFKHHVEKGNLWEQLWVDGTPKRERASQLIYYAMADCFCIANGVDISPEANMGGGPVDFKFSQGYHARVLVEMKRSMGTVRHGYEKQLEHYKGAARTFHGFFVVMDYGDLGDKLEQIQAIRRERLAAGELASEIVVIDATRKESSSKRM